MNNNALLPCFPATGITQLSLSSNFFGFTTNTLGLVILVLWGNKITDAWGISRESWWLLIFTSFCILVSFVTFLAPSGRSKIDEEEPKRKPFNLVSICKSSVVSTWETFSMARSNPQYRKCWIFLLSYFFFSTTGTIITIYIVPLFIEIYKLTLDQVSLLNLYYKIAMVFGILIGFLFDQVSVGEVMMLSIHNVIFQGLLVFLYLGIVFKLKYAGVILIPLAVAVMYSWNTSVARGLMGKLIPAEKKCEFMGLYSTFTYLGISMISIINALLRQLQLSPQTLIIVVFIFTLPGYFFLWLLKRELKE
jgi:MFS-type transporter involved in bile tolerance (Atg22 family)